MIYLNIPHRKKIIESIKNNEYCPYLILGLILFLHIILDSYYILYDTRVLPWDQSGHLTISLTYYHMIKTGYFFEIIGVSRYYPPLYYLSTIPLYLFGISEDISIFVNFFYLAILLFSVYGIGTILFNKKTGLLAAFLISCYPFIITYSRDYMLDLALISTISLSLYFLLKSDNFIDRKYSLFFGTALAGSMLIKWSAIIFLIVPIIFVLYGKKLINPDNLNSIVEPGKKRHESRGNAVLVKNIISKIGEKSTPFANFFLAMAIAFIIAGIWYLPNLSVIITENIHFMKGGTAQPGLLETDPPVLSFDSLFWYMDHTIYHLNLLFTLLFLIGLIFLFYYRDLKDKTLFFLFSIVFPFLFLTFLRGKAGRYTGPLLIFFAIISAFWIFRIDKRLQKIFIVIIIVLGILQVSALTFGFPGLENPMPSSQAQKIPSSGNPLFPSQVPLHENWRVTEVLYSINQSLPENANRGVEVIVLSDHPRVNGPTYNYYARLFNMPISVKNGAYIPIQEFRQNLSNFSYIIYKDGPPYEGTSYMETVEEMYRAFELKRDNYEKIAEFELPDNSNLSIYRNKDI